MYSRDLLVFTKKLSPKQKQHFLEISHSILPNIDRKILTPFVKKKKFPSSKLILSGGGITKSFGKAITKMTKSGKKLVYKTSELYAPKSTRTISTILNLVNGHFQGSKNKEFGNNESRTTKGLSKRASTMAKLANEAYSKIPNRKNVNGYNYLPQYSNKDHAVYRKGDEIVLSARGTQPRLSDLRADLNILAGTYSLDPRFVNYNNLYKKVKKDFGSETNIVTTGHSLGGAQSLFLGNKHNLENYSFNPGVSPLSANFKKLIENPKAHIYHQSGDPISAALLNYDPKNGLILGNPSVNALNNHSLNNFLPKN